MLFVTNKCPIFVYPAGQRQLTPLIYLIITVIALFFTSCNNSSNTRQSNTVYNKVIDSANHLFDAGKYDVATNYINSATKTYHDLTLLQKFEYYSFNYNYYFHIKKDNKRAMPYADSVIALFDTPEKKLNYITKYGQAFFFKGDILFQENKYDEAYRYFYQGKLIGSKDVNRCTLGDFSYRMGMIMYKQEHYRLAAENFKSSSAETGSCDLTFRSFYRRQELLNNTGLCYVKLNEPDSALAYFKKALNFIDEYSSRFRDRHTLFDVARGVVYGNQANIYIRKNNLAVAKNLLKQSIGINLKKGNDNRDAQLSELKLAHIYDETGRQDSLIDLLGVIQKQFADTKNDDAEADWNLLMSEYFTKKHDPKVALSYFTRYDALKDTITAKLAALKDADIEQQIKRIENDEAFSNLKKDSELQNVYLKIAMVFGLMLLIIGLLIFLNWRKSRKNIKTLGSLNNQINKQNYDLESALAELKFNNQEKDRILRAVAHDLRNPLGGIASLTELIEDDGYTDDQKEMIGLIKETAVNSLELINEILEVTNGQTRGANKEHVEINSLLSHSVELLRFKAAEKEQEIKLQLLSAPLELFISREKIWRVMSNLISNAIKFSRSGAITYVKIIKVEDTVEISVKDGGIGIPDKLKDQVFNVFTEAKRSGTDGEKSFGLGLSICRQIVEEHQGAIWFESGANGTTFYVRLPL